MQKLARLFSLAAALVATVTPSLAQDAAADAGFVSIFDPKQKLEDHWDGDPRIWRIEEDCITCETTAETKLDSNSFLIWKDGELDDFELTLEYRWVSQAGNSGIQVRSFRLPNKTWGIGGYQADFEYGPTYSGIIYGEAFRGILANRGQKTEFKDGETTPTLVEEFANSADLQAHIKTNDWNTYKVVCKGWTMQNFINGHKTAELTDNDTKNRRRSGLLALQAHVGPPMKVQFRNLKLKRLPLGDLKKVVFAAGRPSHALWEHEHRAGCKLLADCLNADFNDKVLATVYTGGWPADPTALDNADALIMYCDGGGGHPANSRLKLIQAANDRGMGFGAIHYGVETVVGDPGTSFLKWNGGYFEVNWSVNPHWEADFTELPKHAVTSGVQPFKIHDEWYYHMRFRPDMKNVTPILTAMPPKETLSRPDGPHSGNPAVREAVLNRKEKQHVMWVSENDNGTRGFGFTGGHFHKNWKDDNFRKVVLNAIAWIAKAEIPADGVPVRALTDENMEANLDFEAKSGKRK